MEAHQLPDDLEVVRRRLVTQGLAGPGVATVADAVGLLGAVQAQEYAEAAWSLGERARRCTAADVETAVDRGDILRLHILRPTWHFVTRSDIRWMLRLSRPRVHALNGYMYRQCGLGPAELTRGHRILADLLGDGKPAVRREIEGRFRQEGLEADGFRLAYLLMHAELEEVVCSGPRRGKAHTYALLDQRAPSASSDGGERDRDDAFDELLLRYFRSHGPATVRDFVAWSSFTVRDTKAGLARVGDALVRLRDRSGTHWFAAPGWADHPLPAAATRDAFLIPMYDETIVAYQDLRVAQVPAVPDVSGRPPIERAVVVGGRTLGTWRRTLSRREAAVQATLFVTPSTGQLSALTRAVARFGRFLGLPAVLRTD